MAKKDRSCVSRKPGLIRKTVSRQTGKLQLQTCLSSNLPNVSYLYEFEIIHSQNIQAAPLILLKIYLFKNHV